ncbi:uncharacterized protein LOC125664620 [Ostrea edulis]|uniref:uncharacterized protein LOC125664620 n=1 Tax=Ostrea edulis TaxID=37623 RepID=UPI0024AFD4B2|nr:uncharacterized protein LOC125664620 [Ostrea edulis]
MAIIHVFGFLVLQIGTFRLAWCYNIADYGNFDNTLSMLTPFNGNLVMPADLLQTTVVRPGKNLDKAFSLMKELFFPRDFTITSLANTILEHRPSIIKLLHVLPERRGVLPTKHSVFEDNYMSTLKKKSSGVIV